MCEKNIGNLSVVPDSLTLQKHLELLEQLGGREKLATILGTSNSGNRTFGASFSSMNK